MSYYHKAVNRMQNYTPDARPASRHYWHENMKTARRSVPAPVVSRRAVSARPMPGLTQVDEHMLESNPRFLETQLQKLHQQADQIRKQELSRQDAKPARYPQLEAEMAQLSKKQLAHYELGAVAQAVSKNDEQMARIGSAAERKQATLNRLNSGTVTRRRSELETCDVCTRSVAVITRSMDGKEIKRWCSIHDPEREQRSR